MTTVSRTCQCRKYTHIAVLVATCPGQPSTRKLLRPHVVGKAIWYVCGSSSSVKAAQLHISSAAHPCYVPICLAINPSDISSPHSLYCTRPFCRSRKEGPSPIIRCLYATYDWVPAAWHGRQTMPTAFPTFFRRPTLSNRLTKVLNAPLDPSRFRRCNHAIVRVEEVILMPILLSTLTPLFCALHHNRHPVMHHRIHHHIENGGG